VVKRISERIEEIYEGNSTGTRRRRGTEEIFHLFPIFSGLVALFACALAQVFADEELVIAVVPQEVGTAVDFRIAVILAVLIPCGENVRFTDGLVWDGDDC